MRIFSVVVYLSCFSNLIYGQEIQRLFQETDGTPQSLGVVNPNAGLGGVPSAFHLVAENDGTDSVFYTMSEIVFGAQLFVKSETNLSAILPENHHLLHHIAKGNRWYTFGYEQIDADSIRYFVVRLEQNGTSVEVKLPFHYYSTPFKEEVRAVSNAEVLSSSEIGFVGSVGREVTENRSLFFIFNEDDNQLILADVPNGDNINEQVYPSDVFAHNDSIYTLNLYPLESSKPKSTIGVYSNEGSFVSSKNYAESVAFPGRPSYVFGDHLTHQPWGENMVLSGASVSRDFYYQEYDEGFNLVFDRLFKVDKDEYAPFQDSFFPMSNQFGVMVSFSQLGFFGYNVNHDLILRMYDRVNDTVSVFLLEDENFSHLSGALVVGNKILVTGFTSEKIEGEQENNVVYYLADYNQTSVGLDENCETFANQINVYPNPIKSGGKLNLNWSGMEKQKWEVKLYNQLGQLIQTETISQGFSEFSLRLPELQSGNYIIRAEGGNNQMHASTIVVE